VNSSRFLWAGTAGVTLALLGGLGRGELSAADLAAAPDRPRAFHQNLRAGAGAIFIQDTAISGFSFSAPSITNSWTVPVESDMEFDVGPAIPFAIGGPLPIPSWLHAEFETGFSVNQARFQAAGSQWESDLWQAPLLVNLTVPFRISGAWDAFAGVGGGVVLTIFDLPSWQASTPVPPGSPSSVDFGGATATAYAAYQAFAGVRYQTGDRSALSFRYNFRGGSGPKWSGTGTLNCGVETEWEFDLKSLYSHAFLLTFEWDW